MNYSVILCDCPWNYKDKARAGERGAEFKYSCMTLTDLADMKEYIDTIAAPDSVLFMWATGPMLPDAIFLMNRWCFDYKTVAFTWIKRTKNNKLFWGMGNHTRANPEYVLLGIRGKGVKRISASVHSVVEAKLREHSRKPFEVHNKIVELYGDVPRIELFGRQRIFGWDIYGDEIDKFKSADDNLVV